MSFALDVTPKEVREEQEKRRLEYRSKAAIDVTPENAGEDAASVSEEEGPKHPRTAVEVQKMKLERLMARPDKPIKLPERKERKPPRVRDFNLDVMGSSAGAGSGEFHVYRAGRRREAARVKHVLEEARKLEQQERIQRERAEREALVEAKTAKKRSKRMKQKQRKKAKTGKESETKQETADASDDDNDNDNDNEDGHKDDNNDDNNNKDDDDNKDDNDISNKKDDTNDHVEAAKST